MNDVVPVPHSSEAASLAVTLRMLAEDAGPWLRRTLTAMSTALEQGRSWRETMDAQGKRLPVFLRGALTIAERSGRLGEVLSQYLIVVRRTRRARRRIGGALIYPMIVFIVAAAVASAVTVVIIPTFRQMFDDFGVELPWLTRVLLNISSIMLVAWPWILGAMVGGLLLGSLLLLLPRFTLPAPVMRGFQAIPILGTASWLAAASEFCSLLAIAIKSGEPLPSALKLTSTAMRDSNMRAAARRLALTTERGEPPAYAAAAMPHFRPAVLQVMSHVEHEKSFASVLESHGEMFALQAEAHSRLAVVWIEPFLLVVLGLGIGLVVLAMFLPLVRLMNELS